MGFLMSISANLIQTCPRHCLKLVYRFHFLRQIWLKIIFWVFLVLIKIFCTYSTPDEHCIKVNLLSKSVLFVRKSEENYNVNILYAQFKTWHVPKTDRKDTWTFCLHFSISYLCQEGFSTICHVKTLQSSSRCVSKTPDCFLQLNAETYFSLKKFFFCGRILHSQFFWDNTNFSNYKFYYLTYS